METDETPTPDQWSHDLTKRIGRNIADFRKRLGLSAQDVSARTRKIGYPIARSSIANLERGTKRTITLQECIVLAEAFKIPLAYFIYSPLVPAEESRPTPNADKTPNYLAADRVSTAWQFSSEAEPALMNPVRAVKATARNRTELVDNQAIADETKRLLSLPAPQDGKEGPPYRDMYRWQGKMARSNVPWGKVRDEQNQEDLAQQGIPAWPLEEHRNTDSYWDKNTTRESLTQERYERAALDSANNAEDDE